jgi:hypothetical protein
MMRACLVLALLVGGATARAAPKFTDLATLRAEARDVVIGTVHRSPTGLGIDVEAVVRGSAVAGSSMVLEEAPNERVTVDGQRVVAFIDASGQLRWVGERLVGASLETGVLSMHGFFDRDAHEVDPGIATLTQLREALASGALRQHFVGTLRFPDEHGALRSSRRHLSFEYDPVAHQGTVLGEPLPCLATSAVQGLGQGHLVLSFSDSCPSVASTRSRRLRLAATVTGVDAATGFITVDLTPVEPFLAEDEYERFVADGALASVTRVIALRLPDGTVWQWRVGEGLVDPAGKLHEPAGFSSGVLAGGGSIESTAFEGARVTLAPAPPDEGLESDAALVRAVLAGSITSCRLTHGGQQSVRCKLGRAPSIWRRR